jgi:hypothetical protein
LIAFSATCGPRIWQIIRRRAEKLLDAVCGRGLCGAHTIVKAFQMVAGSSRDASCWRQGSVIMNRHQCSKLVWQDGDVLLRKSRSSLGRHAGRAVAELDGGTTFDADARMARMSILVTLAKVVDSAG